MDYSQYMCIYTQYHGTRVFAHSAPIVGIFLFGIPRGGEREGGVEEKDTRLDLNSLRYIFRGPRYWIPPDNSALNHLSRRRSSGGGCRIGKGAL